MQRCLVLMVSDVNGQVHFGVAPKFSRVVGLAPGGGITYECRKRDRHYDREFAEAMKDWMQRKAEARKRNEEFNDPMPKGPKLLKTFDIDFRTEEQARAFAQKMQMKWDEALEKKQPKKAEEAAGRQDEGKDKEKANDKKEDK